MPPTSTTCASTLTSLGFELQQMDHEDATGQYEINYRFDHALAAADRFMLFKLAAHAVAERHGMVFSCMPKPLAQAPGSGLHFHLSITDAEGGPVFSDESGSWVSAAEARICCWPTGTRGCIGCHVCSDSEQLQALSQ